MTPPSSYLNYQPSVRSARTSTIAEEVDLKDEIAKTIAEISIEDKNEIVASPAILDLLLNREHLATLDDQTLEELSKLIRSKRKDPIDDIIMKFPKGEKIPLGTSETIFW